MVREIFIERQNDILRIAIKNNNKLKECFIEEDSKEPMPGEIYKGIIKNIVPAIKGAFVDIGYKTNCYMYIDKKFKNTHMKKGQELLVQVVKESAGKKEPKITNAISIPGRYCVLNTLNKELTFSKKIVDEEFKTYVKCNIDKPDDIGIMIRTNGEKVSVDVINNEIKNLYNSYVDIKNKSMYSIKPGLLIKNGGILGRILRDKLNHNTIKIYVNEKQDFDEISEYVKSIEDVDIHLEFHQEERELFDYYGIEKEILQLRNPRVHLECGGHIVIEKTEAMHTIDVNSGKNVKSSSIRDTAFITNIQAAEEIVNQIRVRNLSGIIVIDFIDMEDENKKRKVLEKLYRGFEDDKSKTIIYPFTELNLVQIARRKIGRAIYEYINEDCPKCAGSGERVKFSYLKFLIKNEIKKINENNKMENVYIEINNSYEVDIKEDIMNFIKEINAIDKNIFLKFQNLNELFKVEPLLFKNQIDNLENYRIYSAKKLYKE